MRLIAALLQSLHQVFVALGGYLLFSLCPAAARFLAGWVPRPRPGINPRS